MLTFKKIKFKNFLSYGNNETILQLNRGSNTLIVGTNGSGKSSLVTDTLTFALFGKPYRKINKTSLVNSINKKNCLVELEFMKNNVNYIVRRGINPNIFEIYEEGLLLNQKADNNDYQQYLEDEIIQMNYNSFIQTIIIGKKYIPFMQLNASDRREIIEQLFNMNYFTDMNINIKIKSKLNKENITEYKFKISNLENLIKNEKNNLNILKNQNKELIDTYNNEIQNYLKEIDTYKNEIKNIQSNFIKLKEKIINEEQFKENLNKIRIYENQLNNELNNLKEQISFYKNNDSCPVCRQHIDDEFKKIIMEEIKGKENKFNNNFQMLIDKKEQQEKQLLSITSSNQNINNKIEQLNEIYHKKINLIDNLNNNINRNKQYIEKFNENDNIIKDKEQYILDMEKQHNEYVEKFNELNNLQTYYEIILNMLKDDGLKIYFIKMYLPLINDTISKYMDIFDFNCSFTLDEQFNEQLKSRFRDKFTYNNFSEGEKLRIDLALLFVFREISKLRNNVNTNLLILDEVLDGSLDEAGINGFLNILKTIEYDKDVFIISHHSSKYYDLFPNVIEIDKKINYSEIKVDTYIGKIK